MLLLLTLDVLLMLFNTLGKFSRNRAYGGSTSQWTSRVTTRDQDRYCYIRNTHLSNRFQTATATGGISARRPYVVCVLARRHRVNRVHWARTHQRWLRQQWNSVLFSDESRFTIRRGDDRVRL